MHHNPKITELFVLGEASIDTSSALAEIVGGFLSEMDFGLLGTIITGQKKLIPRY